MAGVTTFLAAIVDTYLSRISWPIRLLIVVGMVTTMA